MLNVPDRSPPVPQVSKMPSCRRESLTAFARMVLARPTISAGFSPFIASPMSRPAMCAGADRPSMTSAIAAAASSLVRSSWRVSCSISPAIMSGLPLEEVAEDAVAFSRQNRLRMKLDAVHGPLAMPEAHDHLVVARACRHFELGGQARFGHDQRVVSRGDERLGDAAE